MELTGIRALNYTGLRSTAIDVPRGSRALLIAGPNGAGKTALIDAIRYALAGTLPRGLKLKKDLPELITNGEKDGAITVNYRDAEGREQSITVKLKTGNATSPPPLGAVEASIMSPQEFMALEPSKRRKVLFDWAGISLSLESVMGMLKASGHEDHHLARLSTALKSGFADGERRAKELASEARGAWVATTGENYGSAKAPEWRAPVPDVDADPNETRAALDEANARVARLTSIRDLLQQSEDQHVRAAGQRELAAGRDKAQKALDLAIEKRDEQQARLEAVTSETKADSAGGWTAPCPCCKKVLKSTGPGQLAEYVPASVDPKTALNAVNRERAKLDELNRAVQDCERVLRNADAAALLVEQLPDRPDAEELAGAIEDVRRAVEEQRLASSEHENAVQAQAAAAGAEEKTQRALGYHEDLVAYSKLEADIKGLPARCLDEALTAVNAKLAVSASAYGKPVQIGEDMELWLGSTRYGLLSRSQQWRVELALGMALAAERVGIVLMDEFDLVQPSDRGEILQLVSEQEGVQIVLGATLKGAPELPEEMGIHTVWLGKGE